MKWSTHSRRIDLISRSAKPFCQGDAGAVGLSRMPMSRIRLLTTAHARMRLSSFSVWASGTGNHRVDNGAQVSGLAGLAMKRQPSVDFSGYWQRHREAAN